MITHAFVLKYGESTLPEDQILQGGDPKRRLPISFCAYLLQTEGRNVLIDAGCDTMPGFEMKHFCSLSELLSRLGLAPEQITDVIVTHAHHDHIDGLRNFPNATVYIQEEARIKGQKYLPATATVTTFAKRCTVCEGVEVICIGGHATGSSVVDFTYRGKLYTVVGDECYTAACVERNLPTGASKDPQKSAAFLQDYAKGNLLYCHDPATLPDRNGVAPIA